MRRVTLYDEQGEIWPCLGPGRSWGEALQWVGWDQGGVGWSLAECMWIWVGIVGCVFNVLLSCIDLWLKSVLRMCSKTLSSSLPGLFARLH